MSTKLPLQFPTLWFFSLLVVWIKLQGQVCIHIHFGVTKTLCFLGRVTLSLAQLVLNTELYSFFCLWTLIPVTRRPTWSVECSRRSTSHSYLFVCFGKKKKSHSPYLFFLPSWERSAQSLEKNWWHPSPPLSYVMSFFYAYCIFNLLQLLYGLENPLTEWWLFSWNGATCKAMVVINSAVM